MTVTGMRNTENVLAARKVVDMAQQIALLDPNDAPFVTLLKQMKGGKREVFNPRFDWLEDDLLASTSSVATAISSAATATLTVADGTIFRVNDVLNIPSVGENMLVTAVSGNNLTVTRGYGTTAAAAAIEQGAAVEIIGNAQEEGATLREVKSRNEENAYNLTQIFRTPIALSGTEEQMKMYGGKDRAYQRRKALLEHKRDIAKSLYFGQRKQVGTRRTMGGLVEFIGAANTTAFDVLVDDLNLPFGTIRMRKKGSNGGHNGLGNIQSVLSTDAYARVRFGIGNEYTRGTQINFVLGKWTAEEEQQINDRLKVTTELIPSFCLAGIDRTMNQFNNK